MRLAAEILAITLVTAMIVLFLGVVAHVFSSVEKTTPTTCEVTK